MPMPLWAVSAGTALTMGLIFEDSKEEIAITWAAGTTIGSKAIRAGASWVAKTNAARAAGSMVVRGTGAVVIPVALGYATSYAIGGKSGAADFHDFITGGVSPKQWWNAVTLKKLR